MFVEVSLFDFTLTSSKLCIDTFTQMSSSNEAMEQEDQIKPLWRYDTKLRMTPNGKMP